MAHAVLNSACPFCSGNPGLCTPTWLDDIPQVGAKRPGLPVLEVVENLPGEVLLEEGVAVLVGLEPLVALLAVLDVLPPDAASPLLLLLLLRAAFLGPGGGGGDFNVRIEINPFLPTGLKMAPKVFVKINKFIIFQVF